MSSDEQICGAVVVAAGTGSRVADGDQTPKQFRRLGRDTVLALAVRPFVERGCEPVVVVIAEGNEAIAERALGSLAARVRLVPGGSTRHASALFGVETCDRDWVHIHDGARPYVSPALIDRVESARARSPEAAGVVPVLVVTDSVKRVDGERVEGSIDRDTIGLAQTPQLVRRSEYVRASGSVGPDTPTDDVAVLENAGMKVLTVPGEPENRKITTAADFERHDAGTNVPDIRVGHGYDTHRTSDGNAVHLCGIAIPAPFALDGHSDADVGLHALTDALLGTCGEGDIGSHFPPTDSQWADAASHRFLAHANAIVGTRNGAVTNVDITIICERPKIGPHRDDMRATIADILSIELERVSVKATTNERIGFIGRNEGIAAIATATVRYG